MQPSSIDGPATEYMTIPSTSVTPIECANECLRDPRCLIAVRDNKYCYLKNYPANPGICASGNGCWALKG